MVGKLVVLALACFHEASVAAPLEAAWRISEAAKLDLQSVAQELPGVEELNSCPGINQEPTDLERDFASKPYYKYFTYDTYDARTWSTLAGLDTCLRSVTDEWIGASDLWEANQLLFERFGQQVDKSMWWKQLWIEWDPLPDNKTILSTFPQASAPMSSMPPSSWIQQPCNAMSNAAYFEVSLYACQAASVAMAVCLGIVLFSFHCSNIYRSILLFPSLSWPEICIHNYIYIYVCIYRAAHTHTPF